VGLLPRLFTLFLDPLFEPREALRFVVRLAFLEPRLLPLFLPLPFLEPRRLLPFLEPRRLLPFLEPRRLPPFFEAARRLLPFFLLVRLEPLRLLVRLAPLRLVFLALPACSTMSSTSSSSVSLRGIVMGVGTFTLLTDSLVGMHRPCDQATKHFSSL
jgi:hypothetical protein